MALMDWWRLLRAQWLLLLAAVVAALAVGGVVLWQSTPLYASTVTLFVSAPQDESDTGAAYQGSLLSEQRVASYTRLVASEQVTQPVVERLGLAISAQELAARITARATPETVLITASVTDPVPDVARQVADAVGTRFQEVVAELETPPGGTAPTVRVTVVEPAQLPASPVSPQPVRVLGLALLLGLAAGSALAFARQSLDRAVRTVEQLRTVVDAPVLGAVGHDPEASAHPLLRSGGVSPRAEALRQVRTNLQFVDVDAPPQVVIVTSAVPAEGKTTSACNLGVMLAEAGSTVLLVEADLRRPRATQYLELESAVGLTTVLSGRVGLDDAVQRWGPLAVLASGKLPANPSELLGSQQMRRLLQDMRARFDVVIIDAAPLLAVSDTAALAPACDGAVLVVRYGATRTDQVRDAAERLRAVGSRVLGTVLNMVPGRGPDAYSYGYGYAADSVDPDDGSDEVRVAPAPRRPESAGRGATRADMTGPSDGWASTGPGPDDVEGARVEGARIEGARHGIDAPRARPEARGRRSAGARLVAGADAVGDLRLGAPAPRRAAHRAAR